ncbi:hypothetical protein TNCV_3685191 [Trichonephila clavipes]|nr:hypothetical protein TNCV_3685191 [Trichonephila clavipes]
MWAAYPAGSTRRNLGSSRVSSRDFVSNSKMMVMFHFQPFDMLTPSSGLLPRFEKHCLRLEEDSNAIFHKNIFCILVGNGASFGHLKAKGFCEWNTRNRWRDEQVCPDVDKELWRLGPDGSGVYWRWTSVSRCGQGTMAPWARRLGNCGDVAKEPLEKSDDYPHIKNLLLAGFNSPIAHRDRFVVASTDLGPCGRILVIFELKVYLDN